MNGYSKKVKAFILKLIHIQRFIMKRYPKQDAQAIRKTMNDLEILITNNHSNNFQAFLFFQKKRHLIHSIMPSPSYSGYRKLEEEFQELLEATYTLNLQSA